MTNHTLKLPKQQLNRNKKVLVNLAQLVYTMHKICKVRGSNPGHQKKKKNRNEKIHSQTPLKKELKEYFFFST